MKHTTGPWQVGDSTGDPAQSHAVYASTPCHGMPCGYMVCVTTGYFPWQQRQANARLIAAAPDLLQALQDALDSLEYAQRATFTGYSVRAERITKARAAIAKATGEAA